MSGVSFAGMGSGFPVQDVVEASVNSERAPFVARLNKREGQASTDISAIGALKAALESVSESVEALADVEIACKYARENF